MNEENKMYVEFENFNESTIDLKFPPHLLTESYVLTKVILENVTGNLNEGQVVINDMVVETIKINQWIKYHNLYSSPSWVVPFSFTVSPLGGLPLTTKHSTRISLCFDEPQPSDKLRAIIEWKHVNHHSMLVNSLKWGLNCSCVC